MNLHLTIPLGLPGKARSSARIWQEYLPRSTQVRMTTGYISSDAIIELKKIAELNSNFNFELLIGMHYFELFTRTQFDAVTELSNFLKSNNRGHVYLSSKAKYHGKMYSFLTEDKCFACAIGSSNLGSFIGTSNDLYETDCSFSDAPSCKLIDKNITQIIKDLGEPIEKLSITKFNETNDILDGEYGVEKLDSANLLKIFQKKKRLKFKFPLKTEAKSNLNVYFGKGRQSPRGMVRPRPWYEVEIIVPRAITALDGYPAGSVFDVVTEDGWKFTCSTNGDYGKNFRSNSDLKILGKWIKGSMEKVGVLKIGSPITKDTLDAFGKHSLCLTKTSINNLWTLEMIK